MPAFLFWFLSSKFLVTFFFILSVMNTEYVFKLFPTASPPQTNQPASFLTDSSPSSLDIPLVFF